MSCTDIRLSPCLFATAHHGKALALRPCVTTCLSADEAFGFEAGAVIPSSFMFTTASG